MGRLRQGPALAVAAILYVGASLYAALIVAFALLADKPPLLSVPVDRTYIVTALLTVARSVSDDPPPHRKAHQALYMYFPFNGDFPTLRGNFSAQDEDDPVSVHATCLVRPHLI